jgi:hypothetical protein
VIDVGRFSDRSRRRRHCSDVNDDYTKRLAIAVAAILVVTGCTTESSSEGGCTPKPSGFTGDVTSELGNGSFELTDAKPKTLDTLIGNPTPGAIGEGGEITVKYQRHGEDDGMKLTLRSASADKMKFLVPVESASPLLQESGAKFRAVAPGHVAVLVVPASDESQVIDLVHLRVLTPTKIAFANPGNGDVAKALETGKLSIQVGDSERIDADVLGDADGTLVSLGGLVPKWESSDDEVLLLESRNGSTFVHAQAIGTASLTVSAAALSRVIRVTVEEGAQW